MKIPKPSYLTLTALMTLVLLVHPYIAETNNNLVTKDHLREHIEAESNWMMQNQINMTTKKTSTFLNKDNNSSDVISQTSLQEGDKRENTVVTSTTSMGVIRRHGRNNDGGYHHPSPVHIDFSPIFLAIVPIALFLGAAAAFALATASSSSSSAAATAQQQQQQQEAANNNNNANNANNNNNNALLVALIAAFAQKGHAAKGHKTIIYAYNVTKVHDWRRSFGDSFRFSVPQMKPMNHLYRMRKYSKTEP